MILQTSWKNSTRTLVVVCGLAACDAEPLLDVEASYEAPIGKADGADRGVVDQETSDVTVLRAFVDFPIGAGTSDPWPIDECEPLDEGSVDCTEVFEVRYGAPSLHRIIIPTQNTFRCEVLRVQTVGRSDAVDDADGVGFYYDGYRASGFRFTPNTALKNLAEVSLANGESARVHEFVGLANCFLGTASSSAHAKYVFKPFMAFSDPEGVMYRNWDLSNDYVIDMLNRSFDRSSELLAL